MEPTAMPPAEPRARILLVEDNADLAYGVQNNLEIEGYDVEVAEDGRKGVERVLATRPDLVILDLMLPELDGYGVLRQIRKEGFDGPVLILTARGEEADKVQGFRFGADQYVTKPFGLLELLARVERLLERENVAEPEDPEVWKFGEVEIDSQARRVIREGEEVQLSPKEFDLLVTLLAHEGAAMTRQRLLEEVWEYPSSVLTRTVDTHIAELRRKLETDPAHPEHILTVRKIGYRFQA
jgi:DNA-binding response OmpR family regulator